MFDKTAFIYLYIYYGPFTSIHRYYNSGKCIQYTERFNKNYLGYINFNLLVFMIFLNNKHPYEIVIDR